MRKRYRHPELGYFNKFDLSKGSIGTTIIPDAALLGLVQYLNANRASAVSRILQSMLELQKIEDPVWGETEKERNLLQRTTAMVEKKGIWIPNPLLQRVSPEKYQRGLEIEKRKDLLNRELGRHRFFPVCFANAGWPMGCDLANSIARA